MCFEVLYYHRVKTKKGEGSNIVYRMQDLVFYKKIVVRPPVTQTI